MSQAANKLYGRAEIRNILRDLANDQIRSLVVHRDAFRNDDSHKETDCIICLLWKGRAEGIKVAFRYFGGRRG